MRWRHVVINTAGTWLHGDARGFRSRGHRIHSSGDYRHRPPVGEHSRLHEYQIRISRPEVSIAGDLRPIVGNAMLDACDQKHLRVLAIAVGKVHSHTVIELPESLRTTKAIVGDIKRFSSRKVRRQIPGTVWAAGGTFKFINDDQHLQAAVKYIAFDQGSDAWTSTIWDNCRDGMFGRKRGRDEPHTPG